MIVKALIDAMAADATLAAQLGERLYNGQAPQNVQSPYAVLQIVAGLQDFESLDGPSAMVRRRVQLDIYAKRKELLVLIGDRARSVLRAIRHRDMPFNANSPADVVRVQYVSLINDVDMPEEPGAPQLFRRMMEFSVVHNE